MHSYYYMAELTQEQFIQARLRSAARYQSGTGSPIVRMIGGVAAGMRRASGAIEQWASGPIESAGRQPHATIR